MLKMQADQLRRAAPILEEALAIRMGALSVRELHIAPLSHIKLNAHNGCLSLTAEVPTQLTRSVSLDREPSWVFFTCPVEVTQEGVALVPAGEFLEFCRVLGAVEVGMMLERNAFLHLDAGQSQLRLASSPCSRSPYTGTLESELAGATPEDRGAFTINQLFLASVLRASMNLQESGIIIRFEGGKLHIGKFDCDASKVTGKVGFSMPNVIVEVLLKQLLHDVDVTFRVCTMFECEVLFENPDESPFSLKWFTGP